MSDFSSFVCSKSNARAAAETIGIITAGSVVLAVRIEVELDADCLGSETEHANDFVIRPGPRSSKVLGGMHDHNVPVCVRS